MATKNIVKFGIGDIVEVLDKSISHNPLYGKVVSKQTTVTESAESITTTHIFRTEQGNNFNSLNIVRVVENNSLESDDCY